MPAADLAVVHIAKMELGLAEGEYRQILREAAGVDSASRLTVQGFRAVMARMDALGFRRPWKWATDTGRREGMASAKQIKFVCGLWTKWHGNNDLRAFGRWLEVSFGVSDIRFASDRQCRMAIEALKAMLARAKRVPAVQPDSRSEESE